jgi:hypothetical protein
VLRDIEQLRYWQGQLLRSRDFRDQGAIDAQRRWWHNRAVHAEFGVRFGMKATGTVTAGVLTVLVDCGLAYDCFGRELILETAQPAPPILPGPGSLNLVIAYNRGTTPQLFWKLEREVRIGDGVPVGRVAYSGSAATFDATFRPPYVRAMARPRLSTGDTVHGDTPWEPWVETMIGADGSPTPVTVGVQTHVDTSAAGFTETPNYFATLQWPQLKLEDETFASAYFPSIAEPTESGFIFRLLMKGIARRRLQVAFGVSEALAASSPDPRIVKVASASAFRAGDSVARVVPRANVVSAVDSASGAVLTLHVPLPPMFKDDVLAVGNLPRTALVTAAPKGADTAMVVTIGPGADVQAGDLLVRNLTPDDISAVTDVKGTSVTLDTPIASLKTGDQVGFARPSLTLTVANVDAAGVITLSAPPASPAIQLVVRTTPGASLAAAVVLSIVDKVVTLQTPIPGLATGDSLSPVLQLFSVSALASKKRAMQFPVDRADRFRPGDFIARLDSGMAASIPVQIDSITGKTIFLTAALDHLAKGDTIGAANLGPTYGVTGVAQTGAVMNVTVSTPEGFAIGDLVRKVDGTGVLIPVDNIQANVLTLRSAIAGLQTGDVLVTVRFPRITTVTSVIAVGHYMVLGVDVPLALRVGDLIGRLGDLSLADPAQLLMVVYSVGNFVLVLGAMNLAAGDQIAAVAFRSRAIVVTPPTVAAPKKLTVDRTIDFRHGDLIGPLAAYSESSRPQSIASISTNNLTLGAPIDGLAEDDIVGPASFTPELNRLRLQDSNFLLRGDAVQVAGLDTVQMQPHSGPMQIVDLDTVKNMVTLRPSEPWLSGLRLRPETLSIAALFNPNFVSSFVSFAQKQNLYLCWLGCQTETQNPAQCPGDVPLPDPCGSGD